MTEPLQLRFDRGDHGGVIVTGIDDRNSGGEIYVMIAFNIPDLGVSRPVRKNVGLGADTSGRICCPKVQ
jgi:hypothetical protein